MKIEFDQECSSCSGTGLYSGIGEDKSTAIVCHHCKGTGKSHFEHHYNEFTGRKPKHGIKRVYQSNPGIGIGENEKYSLEDFGGISHSDWDADKGFPQGSEMRIFTCPAWWYQGVNYELKPNWDECRLGGTFSSCNEFGRKHECWRKWDKENNK
ncbi:hypothetical protein LCGC14_1582600 [marine sediment metagenome]|uniref:Uncharacterized protein n=1 Tax=marine sediment metagenome TaxID=412755 RepID=A0A0F9IGM9_9ZZZZ